jgi:PAS domain S-box-containing protein
LRFRRYTLCEREGDRYNDAPVDDQAHNDSILVVDDDAVTRHVLNSTLVAGGFRVRAVDSGRAALEQLAMETPALILLDLVMPEMDGYETLRVLRTMRSIREVPVVVLTALDAEDEVARAFEAGADDFLRKPFRRGELLARVQGQLRLHGAIEQLARKERDANVVLELTQALASNLDFRSILFTVVQRIADVARVDRVSIVLAREIGEIGYVVAASDDERLRDLPIDLTRYPEVQRVLASGEPLVIANTGDHPVMEIMRSDGTLRADLSVRDLSRISPVPSMVPGYAAISSIPPTPRASVPDVNDGAVSAAMVFRSAAILPIPSEGKTIGVLFLRARKSNAIGSHEVALCRTIASTMAIALRNARVLQSLREQTQQVTVARFEAERKLRSLQRYADFFEQSADGIFVTDAEGRVLFSNPMARAIVERSEIELTGVYLSEILSIVPNDASEESKLKHLSQVFIEGRHPRGVDLSVRSKRDIRQTVSASFSSVSREEETVLCTFRDVTHERAVANELETTKDALQRVVDASFDAIVAADTDGRITLFSRAAERLLGFSATDLTGAPIESLFAEQGAKSLLAHLQESNGRIEESRTQLRSNSGGEVAVNMSATLVFEEGHPIGLVGVFTDLTEKQGMQQELAKAQKQLIERERQAAIAALAGAAAHELNQPLQIVIAYAELAVRKLKPQDAAIDAITVLVKEAHRMAEIVRKIGKITRYETKDYLGAQVIVDLDAASAEPMPPSRTKSSEDEKEREA